MINKNTSNALLNMYDLRNTLDRKTKSLTKRHSGTENDTTIGELIDDVVHFLEELEKENKQCT
jgi:hypothetical protein